MELEKGSGDSRTRKSEIRKSQQEVLGRGLQMALYCTADIEGL